MVIWKTSVFRNVFNSTVVIHSSPPSCKQTVSLYKFTNLRTAPLPLLPSVDVVLNEFRCVPTCLSLCIHLHDRGVHVLVSHRLFGLNSLFSCLPKTQRCVERYLKVSPPQPQHSPSTSASLLCPNRPPPSHLSALAKLMAAWLPASIFTG